MNPIEKFLNMFRFRKKEEPKYTQCLSHRTWLSRQVQEEILKRVQYIKKVKREQEDDQWYTRYL